MDKEFLGLGITFKGVDKGLDDSLARATYGFERAAESIGEVEKASSFGGKLGGAFNGLIEGIKLMSIGRIGSTLEEMAEGITGTEKDVNDLSKTLDTMSAKFSFAFDPNRASKLNSTLMTTMANTGLAADEAEKLALGMTNFGRNVDEATASLPFMGKLVGVLGLDVDNVAKMFGQGLSNLRATPDQMKKLIKETVKLGKAYNLTGQVEILPEIFDSVTKKAAKFGQINADAAIRSTMGLSRMVAAFRKVGKSQEEAVGATVSFNDKLAEMQNSILDMQVGLGPMDDSVMKLAQALSIAGITDPFATIKEGLQNPEQLYKTISQQLEGLQGNTKLAVTQRLRQIFGDDVTNLMSTYNDDVKAAVKTADKRADQLGSADKQFSNFEKAMRGTLDVQERMTQASKDLFQVQLDIVNKTKVISHLERERKAFLQMSDAVADVDSNLGGLIRNLDLLKKTGIAGLIGSQTLTTLSTYAGLLSSLLFPLTSMIGLFKIFEAPLKGLGALLLSPFVLGERAILGTSEALFSFGKEVKNFPTYAGVLGLEFGDKVQNTFEKVSSIIETFSNENLGGLKNALLSTGEKVKDFTKMSYGFLSDGMKKMGNLVKNSSFVKVFGETFSKGSNKYFDAINGRINSFTEYLNQGFKNVGNKMLSWVSGPLAKVKDGIFSLGNSIKDFIGKQLSLLGGWFVKVGSQALNFAVSTLSIVGKGLMTVSAQFLATAASGMKIFMSSLASGAVTAARFAGMLLGPVVGAIQAVGVAMLTNPVGLVITGLVALGVAIYETVKHWDEIKAVMSDFYDWAGGKISAFVDMAKSAWNTVADFFTNFPQKASNAWSAVVDAFSFKSLSEGLQKALDIGAALKKTFSEEGIVGVFNYLVDAGSKAIDKIVKMFKNAITNFTLPDWAQGLLFGAKGKSSIQTEKSVVPNNVIDFQAAKEQLGMPSVQTQQQNRIIPQVNQVGAPPRARQPISIDSEPRRQVSDQNFQAIIDELRSLRTSLIDALNQLSDQDISIEIKGDMKRFLQAIKSDSKNSAGARGIGYAVNR